MHSKYSPKIHTYIGHPRSLCGLKAHNDDHCIVSNSTFFAALPNDQCEICIKRLTLRGYDIKALRARYRAIHEVAQQLALVD
jgi:hypothetical protein